jgi:heme O synthase-like polyprenyltransferase
MKAKYVRGMIAGTMIGVGAATALTNSMSRGTKRKMKRTTKKIMNSAQDVMGGVMQMTKR